MDDCDEIMTLGLVDVSHMSIFNDFEETVRNEFHGSIINQFSMITVNSAPADNHESTLGIVTNDLGNDTRALITLYCGQVEGACGFFGNSIDAGNVAANISGSNCDYIYAVLRMNYFLIVTISPVLMMNYFLIVTLRRVLRMKLILIVTQKRRLMMTLAIIVTLVWLRMNLSEWVIRAQYLWTLLTMIIHVSH